MRATKTAKHRRLSGIFTAFLLAAALVQAGPAAAERARIASAPEEEKLVYDISFLIFRNAAMGALTLRFLPERGLYEGVVTAQTKGVIGFLSLYRKDTYRSVMRLSPEGRLIPVEFHKEVRMGGYHESSTTFLDYETGVMRWRSVEEKGGSTETESKSHAIPDGVVYEDFISSFFNLRRGVYGPIQPGKKIRVFSLPTSKWFKEKQKKIQHFTVNVGEWEMGKDGIQAMRIAISVPKELFGQTVGSVRFYVRDDIVPSRIVVKKAVLFGDMRGELRERLILQNRMAGGTFTR